MSEGRWKYKTATVTVDGNAQNVRQLTAGERNQFAQMSAEAKSDRSAALKMAYSLVGWAAVDPRMSLEEVEAMPPELFEACTAKIMELSGFKGADVPAEAALDANEKKSEPLPLNS